MVIEDEVNGNNVMLTAVGCNFVVLADFDFVSNYMIKYLPKHSRLPIYG